MELTKELLAPVASENEEALLRGANWALNWCDSGLVVVVDHGLALVGRKAYGRHLLLLERLQICDGRQLLP
jgi:hypothetical protein